MRNLIMRLTLAAATAGIAASAAAAPADGEQGEQGEQDERAAGLEPVDSIPALTRLHSWSVVDAETLIVWASPSEPYLVRLFRPSPELKFAWTIGVSSFGSRVHAKFDAVQVDGFSYPIREIYELGRDEADALAGRS